MKIFIDESGSFVPIGGISSNISCVAALVIPSCRVEEVYSTFSTMRSSWGYGNDEVKGSKLNEVQIAQVMSLLQKADAIVDICGIDTGTQSPHLVSEGRAIQADKFLANLTPSHSLSIVNKMHEIKQRILSLSPQLFTQFIVSTTLLMQLIELVILYYVQRQPSELSEFHWVLDKKERQTETLWENLIVPLLADNTSIDLLDGADYSYFQKYLVRIEEQPYHWQMARRGHSRLGIDGTKLLEDSRFCDSKNEIGLQLVDIVANTFRRAMVGHIQKTGWIALGPLLIYKPSQVVRLTAFDTDGTKAGQSIKSQNVQGYVLEELKKKSQSMLIPNML